MLSARSPPPSMSYCASEAQYIPSVYHLYPGSWHVVFPQLALLQMPCAPDLRTATTKGPLSVLRTDPLRWHSLICGPTAMLVSSAAR